MSTTTNKRSSKRVVLGILILSFLLLFGYFLYEGIFKKPKELNSGIVKMEKTYREHTKELWAVRFSPDGKLLASGSVDSTVRIWREDSGHFVQALKQPIGITTLDFSPDGKYIVTGSYDEIVRIWDWANNKVVRELKGHKGTIWSVVFSADGKRIASSGEDKIVRLWNAENGELLKQFSGHTRNIWKVRFTPDGKNIVSSGFDKTIKIWNTTDGSLVRTLTGHTEAVVGLAISPDGKTIASGSDDRTIKLWELQTGKLLHTMEGGEEHVYSVAFSPDGKRLVNGNRDKGNIGELLQNFLGDSDGISKGVSMRLWDVQSGQLLQTMSAHANDVMDVCFSPDGKWIASASDDRSVRLWRVLK
jgi:WD40 repeat protein